MKSRKERHKNKCNETFKFLTLHKSYNMGLFFVYILKSAFCLALFYLFYRLLLNRDTFHQFNRFTLILILLASWLIPMIEVVSVHQNEINDTVLTIEQLLLMATNDAEEVITEAAVIPVSTETPPLSMTQLIIRIGLIIYFIGIAFFVMRYIYSFFRLIMLSKHCKKIKLENGCWLLISSKSIAPFSWMKWIVIAEEDRAVSGAEIIAHEMAHINMKHSVDLLIADFSIFLQWFNPAVWLLKQELQNIHEYEADEAVIQQGIDAKRYQLLLIKKAVGTRLYSMANSLNHSTLKKRISMMMKEKSNPWARAKSLCLLPLAALAVTAFARPEISATIDEISTVKVSDLVVNDEILATEIVETPSMEAPLVETAKADKKPTKKGETVQAPIDEKDMKVSMELTVSDLNDTDSAYTLSFNNDQRPGDASKVYLVAQEMPSFPGGEEAMNKYLDKHLSKLKGSDSERVFVKFVVDKDGELNDISIAGTAGKILNVVKEDGVTLASEIIGVLKGMPKWIPGKIHGETVDVRYTLLINIAKKYFDNVVVVGDDSEPLIVVDGNLVDKSELNSIAPENIDAITVKRGDDPAMMEKYGEAAKNGVILIRTSITSADEITGIVEDKDGEPISGAIVQVEGSDKATVTSLNGRFSIKSMEDLILKISYIGYKTETVQTQPGENFVITLSSE